MIRSDVEYITVENSDTDSNPDEELPEYYQPIAAVENEDEEEDEEYGLRFVEVSGEGDELSSYTLPNGYAEEAERVISSIEIHDSDDEEGVMTEAVVSDLEILRAFNEDESRRTAPLPADQALRVMEAMRGVAFAGAAPDWVGQVPEDQWIHQLRRIRESSST